MSKKNFTYENAQRYVKDKDLAVMTFLRNALDKTISMFVYSNLPDTIPYDELEKILQMEGKACIAKVNGKLYALGGGGYSGEVDVYGNPTQYTVTNVALDLTKTYDIGKNCVIIKNDFSETGLVPIFSRYATLITDTEISMNMASILLRIPLLISAPDDKTKASADVFIKHIMDGDFSIIGDSPFFDGVKTHNTLNNYNAYLTGFIELMQYYKASFLNEIGLNANYNMKRERLTENEVGLNIDALLPLVDNMYAERVKGLKAVNDMFKTDIVVDYNSAWKATHEENEKEQVSQDTAIEDDLIEDMENKSVEADTDDWGEMEFTFDDETEETSTDEPTEETEETGETAPDDSELVETVKEVIEEVAKEVLEDTTESEDTDNEES